VRQFEEPEHGQEIETGVGSNLIVAERVLAGELPPGVDRAPPNDYRTRGLEGLIIEGAEPIDCNQPRFDRAYPQIGEALGTERLPSRGAQGVPVEPAATGRGR
jgi:hypothetical protein